MLGTVGVQAGGIGSQPIIGLGMHPDLAALPPRQSLLLVRIALAAEYERGVEVRSLDEQRKEDAIALFALGCLRTFTDSSGTCWYQATPKGRAFVAHQRLSVVE